MADSHKIITIFIVL